jgi:hypothetical protein
MWRDEHRRAYSIWNGTTAPALANRVPMAIRARRLRRPIALHKLRETAVPPQALARGAQVRLEARAV